MRIIVRSALSECELDAPPRAAAKELFTLLCKNLLIIETWYFGLMYKGPDDDDVWIDGSKKKLRDLGNVLNKLNFVAKYYPEDVGEELVEAGTIELFFAQISAGIVRDEIFCPADTCVLLASYALQAKYADYDPEQHQNRFKIEKLIPERIFKQHKMTESEWLENIVEMWREHKGMDAEDAMLEYLKLVQNLEMYGVTYFHITNRKGTNLLLGINSLGLDIYRTEDRLNPQISFPWSEIKNLKFRDRKFTIKPVGKVASDFVFFTSSGKLSKTILNLGIGNHALYIKRRKSDNLEFSKKREKAQEARKARQLQKQRWLQECTAREEIERREADYKNAIKSMKEEMERNMASLAQAQITIQKLQEQLDDLRKSKEELVAQQNELHAMMKRLELSKNMEMVEKEKLEDEIERKQAEVQRIRDQVAEKDAETRRLQDEIEEAHQREAMQQQQKLEEEQQRRLEEMARKEDEIELETLPDDANTSLPELVQINDQLREQLKILQDKLHVSKNEQMDTNLDKIHEMNVKQGRDKYKTLADIRRGNTGRRVEMFENM